MCDAARRNRPQDGTINIKLLVTNPLRSRTRVIAWVWFGALVLGMVSAVSTGAKDARLPHMRVAERLAKSKVVSRRICTSCHTIGESGGTAGPILNQVANRRSPEWLLRWLKDPSAVKPGTLMPNFQLTDDEIEEIVGYLKDMRREIDGAGILAAHSDPVAAGEALFEAYDCIACHRIGDRGRFVGPDLTWVGHRKSESWETVWLRDPEAYRHGTFMPNFHLSEPEIEALVAYLHSLQGQYDDRSRKWEAMAGMSSRSREKGRRIAERLGCWSCHGKDLKGGVANPNAEPYGFVPPLTTAYQELGEQELRERIMFEAIPSKMDAAADQPPYSHPSWKDALTASEMKHLVTYIKGLVPARPEKPEQ